MTTLVWIPLLLPLLASALPVLAHRVLGHDVAWTRRIDLVAALTVLGCGAALVAEVRLRGPIQAAGGLLRADALSTYMITTVGAVATVALWGGTSSSPRGTGPTRRRDRYYPALLALFLSAMSLAVLADNLGLLWVAVEATTITTAFLVGHHGGKASLEAAWKYVVLGSVGVALALLGLVLLYATTRAAGVPTLSWTILATSTTPLDPAVTRIAIALTALGFATKAGLAPMHSWLPDAHSQAPAPVSGLMSGVLLSVAFYAVLRIQVVSDLRLGEIFMRHLLTAAGLLSLAVAAALFIAQRDYKRLLAYSSIEHMGVLALGAAAGGPLARTAVLLHILGHGLIKSVMFVLAGRILTATGSSQIQHVQRLLHHRPDLAVPFLAGTAALLGLPPFPLFFTEVAILLAGWRQGMGWAIAAALVLLLVAFAGIGRHALTMTLHGGADDGVTPPATPNPGPDPEPDHGADPEPVRGPGPRGAGARWPATLPVAVGLGAALLLPFSAWPITGALTDAAATLAGGR